MMVAAKVDSCDINGTSYAEPADGVHMFSRGATGRVCCVLYAGPEYLAESLAKGGKLNTLEEVEAWAESVPGGYLDY